MKTFNVSTEPIESLEYRSERRGVVTMVDMYRFVSDEGDNIVKVVTDNHFAGVEAEYALAYQLYPEYQAKRQAVLKAEINGQMVMCDQLTLINGNDKKCIFFDISEFFDKTLE
jgi:hypothetical protein